MGKRASVVARERARRQRDTRLQRQTAELAKRMGWYEAIAALPAAARDHILRGRVGLPKLVFDDGVSKDAQTFLSSELEVFFKTQELAVTGGKLAKGEEYVAPLGELMTIIPGMQNGMFRVPRLQIGYDNYRLMVKLNNAVHETLKAFRDLAWTEISQHLHILFLYLNRQDDKFFRMTWHRPPEIRSGFGGELKIEAHRVERREFLIDGARRTTYRVCLPNLDKNGGTLDAGLFGGKPGERLPVYVQKHAIRRLRERLPRIKEVSDSFVGMTLHQTPEVVFRDEVKAHLVAFVYTGYKLGYFIARVIDGRVILNSFVFLTMSQTPEGQKLYELLRLTQSDMEWNRLHDLDTFVTSDLFDDPVLGKALVASGCEGLKQFCEREREDGEVSRVHVAANLKKYMQIDARRESRLLERLERLEQLTEAAPDAVVAA